METKIKKLFCYITLSLTILMWFETSAFCSTMVIPNANIAIDKAGFVAVGKIILRDKKVIFEPSEVLKGSLNAKDIEIGDIIIGELISPEVLMKLAKESQIVFVGNIDKETGKLIPSYGLSSIWPQGVPKDYLKGTDDVAAINAARQIAKFEKEKKCDVVFGGTVQKVAHFKEIDEFASYYRAEIKLDKIEKGLQGEKLLGVINVYYSNATKEGGLSENSLSLQSGQRVMLFAQLKLGIIDEGFVFFIPSIGSVEPL